MAQLKMYWLPGTPIQEIPLPEGYSYSHYTCEEDRIAWHHICLNGLTREGDEEGAWHREIATWPDIDPYRDMIFLDYHGEHIGTVTAFVWKKEHVGDVHMVSIRTDFRGKGLAKYLTQAALLKHNQEKGLRWVELTTGEARIAAVKGYLSAGFLPVEYDYGMQARWEAVLETYQMDHIQMLYEDATPYKLIYRSSKAVHPKVKIGVVGGKRGRTMINYCQNSDNAVLTAICDNNPEQLEAAKRDFGNDIQYYSDFEDMLKSDVDCVVLANFANAHAPLAIRALKAGKNVLSEVLPVQTMKEAVELIEAVEQSGKVYAYAENYCYMPAPRKMRWMYRQGWIGNFEYGEGEYMHNCEPGWYGLVTASPDHWRNTMSAFYYCTHSLGPLIHISGLRPVSVTGFEAPFNERMARMGAKAGPFGVEMVTLENGAILKSLHGVGPSRNSIWYSVYGSRGRVESSREDAGLGGVKTLYLSNDHEEGDNDFWVQTPNTDDGLSAKAGASGHGGSDYYVMYNMCEAVLGNKQADIVNVYEAMDMFLPGMFAYRSVRNGGIPMAIPDLRDPKERDKWRNDTECTDPAVAGDQLIPSYSKGNPVIPADTYEKLKARQARAKAENDVKNAERAAKS